MFSTAQQEYIEALLPTYAKDGYKYYVVYSNTVANSSYYGSTEPDLYSIFSKEPITGTDGYTYVIEADSIIVSVRTGNYSSSSSAVNTDRVTVTDYSAKTLSIDAYEHIYTNAEFSGHTLQPNYYLASGGETNVQIEAINLVILTIFIFTLLRKLWHDRASSFR